jgi:hypothetical protein
MKKCSFANLRKYVNKNVRRYHGSDILQLQLRVCNGTYPIHGDSTSIILKNKFYPPPPQEKT